MSKRPLATAGVVAFAASLVAWAWLGDWRWAVTGLAVLLVCSAISETGRRSRTHPGGH
jgi:hypothetical protein